jgi:hypothetical protein
MSFVSVGEEANFVPGTQVIVDEDAGWPLIADLSLSASPPNGFYNGHYGFLDGSILVERLFNVEGGQTPAVAITVGAIGFIGQLSFCRFAFRSNSMITPHDEDGHEGRISFHYSPL